MKLSLNLFIPIVLVAIFISCTNMSAKTEVIVPEKKIIQIIVQTNKDGYEYSYIFTLEYDEKGRIRKIEPNHPNDFGITRFDYGSNTFSMRKGDTYISSLLNEEGDIQSSEDFDYEEMLVGNMTYNNKRQLISIQHPEAGELIFTWVNDDMVQLNLMDEQLNIVYTSLENKNNLGILLTIDKENCTPVFPYYMRLGKPSKHLPHSIGQGEQKITYQYKLNDDGYINEITMVYPHEMVSVGKNVHYKFVYE